MTPLTKQALISGALLLACIVAGVTLAALHDAAPGWLPVLIPFLAGHTVATGAISATTAGAAPLTSSPPPATAPAAPVAPAPPVAVGGG